MADGLYALLISISSFLCLISAVLGFNFVDNYLIDCGSFLNSTVGNRIFLSDDSDDFSTAPKVFVSSSSVSDASTPYSAVHTTARIFTETSNYTFPIRLKGWHFIRLIFSPFVHKNYNWRTARFSVFAQEYAFLRGFQLSNSSVLKEYSMNITSNSLTLTFSPSANSFAFINGIEVFSIPDEVFPDVVDTIDAEGMQASLQKRALETVLRVNMGGIEVSPDNDTLWRKWDSELTHLRHPNLVRFVSTKNVNYSLKWPTKFVAPPQVFMTATKLAAESDPNFNANMSWVYDVDPGFEYLVRFHFCDFAKETADRLFFSVYLNSFSVVKDFDIGSKTSKTLATPYTMDVVARISDTRVLSVSIGPSNPLLHHVPDGILNGLEVMKISGLKGSLAFVSPEGSAQRSSSRSKIGPVTGIVCGVVFLGFIIATILVLAVRKRRRRQEIEDTLFHGSGGKNVNGSSNAGYFFPLVAVKEATQNFNENMVIGVGGFGKVYLGKLRDGTLVAVKRGNPQSRQGILEFQTEIEMLSQFRHRHLVSLIGYSDENNETIIICEYMKNGSLKDHLYGSDFPRLNWKQRLRICIGAAKGLHYLHTGSMNPIIHRDVKSANILLDESMMAKVADFGISKTGPDLDKTHVTTVVKGSFGYLDPEYLIRQQLSEKSDIFSFGVVLLEVICGRPVIDPSLPREEVILTEWAMKWQRKGELMEIIDPQLVGRVTHDSVRRFGEIAIACLAECGIERPTMGYVLWNLESILQTEESEELVSAHTSEVPLWSHSCSNSSSGDSCVHLGSDSAIDISVTSMSKVFSSMVKEGGLD